MANVSKLKLPDNTEVDIKDSRISGIDSSPTSNSTNIITSGGVYTAIDAIKNTTGSTDTSNKIYLVGATTQATNPQTYSDDEVYTTNGTLTTKSIQVGGSAATIQYNSTDQSIEFIFT